MPTVLREAGFEVVIRTDDHEPPHVHVFRAGQEVVVDLEPVWARRRKGVDDRVLAKAMLFVAAHRAYLLAAWREIHG